MRKYHLGLIFGFIASTLGSPNSHSLCQLAAQSSESSAQNIDAKALLMNSLLSSGSQGRASTVKDFIAHGTIAVGAQGNSGEVTLKGRGDDQFRMDYDAEGQANSWAVNKGTGQFKNVHLHKVGTIASYNVVNQGWLTMPYLRIAAALIDPGLEVKFMGSQSIDGVDAYRLRVIRHFPKQQDPKDLLSQLRTTDYYLTTSDLKIIRMDDSVHPNRAAIGLDSYGHVAIRSIPRSMLYSDFHTVDGIQVPFSITEKVANQAMWTIHLSDVTFDTGPSDADFSLQ